MTPPNPDQVEHLGSSLTLPSLRVFSVVCEKLTVCGYEGVDIVLRVAEWLQFL